MLANLLNRRAGCVNRARPDLWGVWGASPIFTRWVDTNTNIYEYKKINFLPPNVEFKKASVVHPIKITDDDALINFIRCSDSNLNRLKNTTNILNNGIKRIRGNHAFWNKIFLQFSKDVNMPHDEVLQDWLIKNISENIDRFKNGDFDVNVK